MDTPTAPSQEWLGTLGFTLSFASAVLGMLGTCLMSRRYAPRFLRSMLDAVMWPILYLVGRGERVRGFLTARARINWDVSESAADMALGMTLLFWAFLLQLVALLAERLC